MLSLLFLEKHESFMSRVCAPMRKEKCEFWQREYWVMCKTEPHGILVAKQGSHLLLPEVSHFVANFTIRLCTVARAHRAAEQSDICLQLNLWQSE